ncbi:hypothetical protein [Clostridium sp.]|uniref:hypothetical protein n=1 Tax=Clostridium sp. TaxID=1506 RepID=UPI002FCB4A9C
MLSLEELAVLQNITAKQQESRVEDCSCLLASHFTEERCWELRYTQKEIDYAKKNILKINESKEDEEMEKRAMDMRLVTGVGADRGITKEGTKVDNLNVANTTIKKTYSNRVFSNMIIKKSDGSGTVYFPVLMLTNTKDKLLDGSDFIEGNRSAFVEVQTVPILSECVIKKNTLHENAKETNDKLFKDQLEKLIEEVSLDRLTKSVNEVNLLPTGTTVLDSVDTLFAEYINKYLSENYLICNAVDYKKLLKVRDAGQKLVKIEKDDITREVKAFINDVEIIVNDVATSLILFNPTCIGLGVGKLNEYAQCLDSEEARKGFEGYSKRVANGFVPVDKFGVKSIKLS